VEIEAAQLPQVGGFQNGIHTPLSYLAAEGQVQKLQVSEARRGGQQFSHAVVRVGVAQFQFGDTRPVGRGQQVEQGVRTCRVGGQDKRPQSPEERAPSERRDSTRPNLIVGQTQPGEPR
jgi:hypothetical protein